MIDYYLFLDESGDHGLTELNASFPVFLLCGIIFSSDEYIKIDQCLNNVKTGFWDNKEVIFHSRDIRKCEKEFQILLDLDIKSNFYKDLNNCLSIGNYTIITSAINKNHYIKKFGRLSNNVYELCLSFIIERSIFFLDDIKSINKRLSIIIERRGAKEDKNLEEHFQRLMSRGTGYVSAERLKTYALTINFRSKKQNINGLQLADLVAYPTARFVINPNRANPSYEIFSSKFYTKNGKRYGFKIYP